LVRLITGSGTRNVVSRDDLLARVAYEDGYDGDALSGILDVLEKIRLIRQERRHNVSVYEITSEFLIDLIGEEAKGICQGRRSCASATSSIFSAAMCIL